ncbi:MAG: VWA domain-containing protein [Deltaproteobacteria bacterium]|nr:VWA domain-containing protein [Deltaproteobacteria bacterium]
MSSLRHLWFDSRHLLGNATGQTLLTDLDALGARTREMLLATGDRLAALSLTLAQTYCRVAPAAWRIFGTKEFPRWVAIGERLAGEEPSSREGATAYFTIDPQSLPQIGLDTVEAWSEIGRETSKVSRRLGTQYFMSSAPLLATLPAPIPDRLRAWARHGCALLKMKGWKGEFLAVSYFEAAAAALPIFNSEEMAAWATLGMLVQDSGPWTFYAALPKGFAECSTAERMSLLKACQQAANTAAKAATEVFAQLPPALLPFPPHERTFLLSLLVPVVRTEPGAIVPLLPLLPSFVRTVQIDQRPWLQERLLTLAQQLPMTVAPLIRTLPRAYEEAGETGLSEWLAKGMDVAKENVAAGVAYFALESRTSLRQLRQASQGVELEEVQELLRKCVQMLSRTPVGIRKQDVFAYPPPLEDFPFYNDALPLPARIDVLSTYEDNFRLFRLVALQHAGRREFGTYEFSLTDIWPQLPSAVQKVLSADQEQSGGLAEYFRCFPHPDILEALFLVIETQRVETQMRRMYRGLHDELHWVTALALPSLLPDLLLPLVPQLRAQGQNHRSVYESARAAAEIYVQLLAAISEARNARDPAAFNALLFDKITGETLIDPEMEDDYLSSEAPELPQLQLDPERDEREGGSPMSAEELKKLIEAGVDLQIRQGKSDNIAPQGLYISDLDGKLPNDGTREQVEPGADIVVAGQRRRERDAALTFFYDEWDYQIGDYRSRWCKLREIILAGDAGEYFSQTLNDYAALTPAVKHEFQRIRPEQYRVVRGLEDGEEFDFNAVVTAANDVRAGVSPSSKLYTIRRQTERDVAALFLLDMSASTDEPIVPVVRQYTEEEQDDWQAMWKKRPMTPEPKPRRIIDVTKEALVLMAGALEEIGDTYAIYGFSGQGRENVEFYHVKSFVEALSPTVKGRIGAIEPKQSTRMGTALRHAIEKLKDVACRVKLLVLLSDGFPQDMDYGSDRRSITYGIRDTMTALQEADRAGILTFCLTVDKAGHGYLREMCEPARYLVLEDVASLPTELPKVYQRYIRPRGV